jgi:hypothetical protein
MWRTRAGTIDDIEDRRDDGGNGPEAAVGNRPRVLAVWRLGS